MGTGQKHPWTKAPYKEIIIQSFTFFILMMILKKEGWERGVVLDILYLPQKIVLFVYFVPDFNF